jgi:NAD(P)-dependent dehydrogenase (short-subunit alcohol dehydrogenase family)
MPFPSRPRAVVTGAGSGLGRGFCEELAARGAQILASDVDLAAARATAEACGAGAHAVACDVSRLEDVEALAREATSRLGGVDLVVNNAGVAVGGRVGEIPIRDWQWIVGVNLWGVIYGCHVFAPMLRRQRSGHILNVASAAGLLCGPMMGPYNVTKAGVVGLSETLYAELHADGVGVSALCPTFFRTNIARAARSTGDGSEIEIAERLMARGKLSARDVARIALDEAQAGTLHIVPHADGRWMWRLKRMAPARFYSMIPLVMARVLKKREDTP